MFAWEKLGDARGCSGRNASVGLGLGLVLECGSPALAADLPLEAPALRAVYDWTGFYVGGHFDYGGGSLNPLLLQSVLFPHSPTALIGGYQLGHSREFATNIVLGVEADPIFTTYLDRAALARMPPCGQRPGPLREILVAEQRPETLS
ncbi:hypothetical protein [Bradyrhizobium sp. B117]|uniref:hypothetical protein n=1 Tax=Bradyrhizobium sp. B117 TaxID=3140246 RepID=UPI0031840B0E